MRFEAVEAKGTSIVFFNEKLKCGLSKEEVLSKYSYVVANSSSVGELGTDKKTFFAERYGGDAILRNGGGGRCGFDGDFQVKGIGPNQLVGEDVEAADGNGFMSLDSAIYESIWAEIIHIALPYGAVRAVAVIDTGSDFEHGGKSYPRGLLVRMPAVRPAHFIRAAYFKERPTGSMSEDAKRVRAVVKRLVGFLPVNKDGLITGTLCEQLSIGLSELAKRFARQFATARAKRIIHYNISASNISLDGAWLDFSSTRIFSNLICGDRVDFENFTGEHISAIESIESICYYLSKYGVVSADDSSEILRKVVSEFVLEYNKQFNLHCVMRMGFPSCLLNKVAESNILLEFSGALQKVLDSDDFSMTSISTEAGWKGYEPWGYRFYAALLRGKALNVEQNLSMLNIELTLLRKLAATYSQLFELVCDKARSMGISRANVIFGTAVNLTRINHTSILLADLEKHIAETMERKGRTEEGYGTLVEDAADAACLQFSTEKGVTIPFWFSGSLKIWYDIKSGLYVIKQACGNLFSVKCLFELDIDKAELARAVSFYGDIWGFVHEKNV